MQPGRSQRAPGSFSPLPGSIPSSAAAAAAAASSQSLQQQQQQIRPLIRRIESSSSDEAPQVSVSVSKSRSPQTPTFGGAVSPSYFTAHPNGSNSSLHTLNSPQNFSRPTRPNNDGRTASPLTLPPTRGYHSRKHSQTPGLFEPTLPSTSTSNLTHIAMAQQQQQPTQTVPPTSAPSPALSASHIAAQAAVAMQQQQQQQQQQQLQHHSRHRSQTVPFPGSDGHEPLKRPGSRSNAGLSPPMLSLTEASVPRDGGFGGYHNVLLGGHSQAATTAANVVFPRTSPQSSPGLPPPHEQPFPAPPLVTAEKPAKAEKSTKVKLFSRPKKIDTKGETKEKPVPSPGKIGSALASLQRGNYSTASLVDSQSLYSLGNSSSATIRPMDTPVEKEREKEKKHHFLSRQKHKLSSKDDYHLALSSAASNSRPVDPHAPSSLYSFNVPLSPGPTKSVSGLDLRHGGRALREKRKEDKLGMQYDNDSLFTLNSLEWPAPSTSTLSLGTSSLTQTTSNLTLLDPVDGSKYGLNNMTLDDAWPYLKAKLLVIFEGEDLRLPVEDLNRVVTMHIQYCIQRRSGHVMVEDVRELLATGFSSLDHTLRKTPEDRLIPALVELWIFTFTSILPYMQAVFLPLDLEFAGQGPLMTPQQARDFWGAALAKDANLTPATASDVLDVRRLVLLAYRDMLILPRYDKLRTIFSRLSLEHLPSSLASLALASPPPTAGDGMMSSSPRDINAFNSEQHRPGTAMSLDPSIASYNSSSSTLLNDNSSSIAGRSRGLSNVSFGSGVSHEGPLRPFTPGGRERDRDQNVEGSKQVTDMVGRMLQCMSVLAGVGSCTLDTQTAPDGSSKPCPGDEESKMVAELGRLLKLNWLGRGRTGRNRRGMVGGRVRREDSGGFGIQALREAVGAAG